MPREKALPIASQVPEQDGLDGGPADYADAGCLGRVASWLPRANRLAPSAVEWLLFRRRGIVRPAGLDLPAEIPHRNACSDQPHTSPRDESEQVLTGLVHVVHR
jgi:hypothetical protein